MFQSFRKSLACLTLVMFGALSVSGSGFHYLPIFGLHADHCSPVVEAACSHDHADDHSASDQSGSRVASNLIRHHSHDECLVCSFYAQGNSIPAQVEALSDFTPAIGEVVTKVGLLNSQRLQDQLARGPPLFA